MYKHLKDNMGSELKLNYRLIIVRGPNDISFYLLESTFYQMANNRAQNFWTLRSPGIDSKEPIPPAYVAWAGIFKRVWGPGIDAKEWIPPAYVAWRASTITLFLLGS